MRIESWNINSIRAHLDALQLHLQCSRPDVLCLQETMVTDGRFPHAQLSSVGYQAVCHGQKGKNGVAVLVPEPIAASGSLLRPSLPLAPANPVPPFVPPVGVPAANEARFVTQQVASVLVACVYVPFGRVPGEPQWTSKLAFFEALTRWSAACLQAGHALLLVGDFNVAPREKDVCDESQFVDHAWTHPHMRAALGKLLATGLVDVGARYCPQGGQPTIWDERRFGKGTDRGVRVDLLLASPALAARCTGAGILGDRRAWPRTSDHVPVYAEFDGAGALDATRLGSPAPT